MSWIKWWLWAPVNYDENIAHTIFRMLGNIFRGVISLCVLFGIILFFGSVYEKRENKKRNATRNALLSKISVLDVKYDTNTCQKTTPVSVAIQNGSEREISSLRLKMSVSFSGRSTNLLSYADSNRNWDFIIKPNSQRVACFGFSGLTIPNNGENPSINFDDLIPQSGKQKQEANPFDQFDELPPTNAAINAASLVWSASIEWHSINFR